MPLHKSSRASRLDPTMISAPLGDFRHTMHIGRGGDAFGDTSFLSTLGPSSPKPDPANAPESPQNNELRHSDSVSSLNLDLDLDLGPSMLGDVLGVMDALLPPSNCGRPPAGIGDQRFPPVPCLTTQRLMTALQPESPGRQEAKLVESSEN
uniref:CDC42 effector protein (Rho GTPase binding) 5 n=1 Tax=Pundamilia nyererei TaxID=303518 RepID=A0A3B4F044_9CICH